MASTVTNLLEECMPPIPAVPKLRGRIHLAALFPVSFACINLHSLVRTFRPELVLASAMFAFSSIALFLSSSLLHLRWWPQKVYKLLKRIDHSNIFLLVSGTFHILIGGTSTKWKNALLFYNWFFAACGVCYRMMFEQPKKLVLALIFITYSWSFMIFIPFFGLSTEHLIRVIIGGLLYTGGLCFSLVSHLRRSNLRVEKAKSLSSLFWIS
ncbi:hypothetical protein RCL1_004316 [Eukaryota sp. TZLM3-RCL]